MKKFVFLRWKIDLSELLKMGAIEKVNKCLEQKTERLGNAFNCPGEIGTGRRM